jgi:hypothetical protein
MPSRRLLARDLKKHRMVCLRYDLAFREVKRLHRLLRASRKRGGSTNGSGKKVAARVHETI